MNKYHGDIWALAARTTAALTVVPTNLIVKRDLSAVMGAGLAKQAARRHPELPGEYGTELLTRGTSPSQRAGLYFAAHAPVVCLPTKYDWREGADRDLMMRGLQELRHAAQARPGTQFLVPLLGAGYGGLTEQESVSLMQGFLADLANVTVVMNDEQNAPTPERATDSPLVDLVRGKKVISTAGHRPDKLGGYGLLATQHVREFALAVLRREQPEVVISGMAQGWDTALAEAARELNIPLIAAIPVRDFEARWPIAEARQRFRDLVAYAAHSGGVAYVHACVYDEVGPVGLQHRNEWMVDLVDASEHPHSAVVALWNKTEGGTRNCLVYAHRQGVTTRNYWAAFEATSAPIPAPQAKGGNRTPPAATLRPAAAARRHLPQPKPGLAAA